MTALRLGERVRITRGKWIGSLGWLMAHAATERGLRVGYIVRLGRAHLVFFDSDDVERVQ